MAPDLKSLLSVPFAPIDAVALLPRT